MNMGKQLTIAWRVSIPGYSPEDDKITYDVWFPPREKVFALKKYADDFADSYRNHEFFPKYLKIKIDKIILDENAEEKDEHETNKRTS